MHLGYIIIYVPDVEAALDFYTQAFGLKKLFLHDSLQYGELDTGSTKLAFVSEFLAESNGASFVPNRRDAQKAAGFEIALVTEDVLQGYKKACDAGAIKVAEPVQKPWGQTVAYVRDLNGVLVEICSPMG